MLINKDLKGEMIVSMSPIMLMFGGIMAWISFGGDLWFLADPEYNKILDHLRSPMTRLVSLLIVAVNVFLCISTNVDLKKTAAAFLAMNLGVFLLITVIAISTIVHDHLSTIVGFIVAFIGIYVSIYLMTVVFSYFKKVLDR